MWNLDLKIGDICKVVQAWHLYLSYDKFAIKAGHADIVSNRYITKNNYKTIKNRLVRVLYIENCDYDVFTILAIVETFDNLPYAKFVINTEGLSPSLDGLNNSFVNKYLEGKPLTEMISNECVSESLIDAIIGKNPMDIRYINSTLLSDDHYKRVLGKDGGLLGLIPIERRTLGLCKLAIKDEPYAETFVPENLKNLVKNI